MRKYIFLILILVSAFVSWFFVQGVSFEVAPHPEPEIEVLDFSYNGESADIRIRAWDASGIYSAVAVIKDSTGEEMKREMLSSEGSDIYGGTIPVSDFTADSYTIDVFALDNLGYGADNLVQAGSFDFSSNNEEVQGCTDPEALNYNPEANVNDGSCQYEEVYGCTDPEALNYNPEADVDDGSCRYLEEASEYLVDFSGVKCGYFFINGSEDFFDYCSKGVNYLNNNTFKVSSNNPTLYPVVGKVYKEWNVQRQVPGSDIILDIILFYNEETGEWVLRAEEDLENVSSWSASQNQIWFWDSVTGGESSPPSVFRNENEDESCSNAPEYFDLFCSYDGSATVRPVTTSSASLFLDPEYIEKTEKERLFRPTEPFSPFDDVICELKVEEDSFSKTKEFDGRLVTPHTSPDSQKGELTPNFHEIIDSGKLKYDQDLSSSDPDFDYFQWKIIGWPEGWTNDDEIMERIFRLGREVECVVDVGAEKKIAQKKTKGYGDTIILWGPDGSVGGHPSGKLILTAKQAGLEKTERWLVAKAINNYENGYHKIDPFMSYKEKFRWEAYLGVISGSGEWNINSMDSLDMQMWSEDVSGDVYSLLPSSKIYVIYADIPDSWGGFAYRNSGLSFLNTDQPAMVTVHESGHAFCGVEDEYIYSSSAPHSAKGINCFSNLPLEFFPYGKPYLGCSELKAFRTSRHSIMKNALERPHKFNDWSCAHCLSKILSGDQKIKEYTELARNNLSCISESPSPEDYEIECFSPNSLTGSVHCSEKYTGSFQNKDCWECNDSFVCEKKPAGGTRCEKTLKAGRCDEEGECVLY